jgi:cytidylate kinase
MRRSLKIFVMGMTASGKSSQAQTIARHFGFPYLSGSETLLRLSRITEARDRHFWLGPSGAEMDALRDSSSVDLDTDTSLLRQCTDLNFVVSDSWTLPWLYTGADALRIYLDSPLAARGQMAYVSKLDKGIDEIALRELIKHKDETSKTRFQKLYGFDITSKSGFDFVLDNSLNTPEQTSQILIELVNQKLSY